MLTLTRSPHAAVVAALAAVEEGSVGPTSASGWTAVWSPEHDALAALPHAILLAEEQDGASVTVHGPHGATRWETSQTGPEERAPIAAALAAAFDASARATELAAALEGASIPDDVTDAMSGLLDLPALDPDRPRRALTLHRGRTPDARMGARIAAREVGEARLWVLDAEWTAVATQDPADSPITAAGVAAVGGGRHRVTMLLWRGEGEACGFDLFHKGDPVAGGQWSTGWTSLDPQEWQQRDAAAMEIVRRLGLDDARASRLRALMRADSRAGDPLAELSDILNLPAASLALLDHGEAPGIELEPVAPAGMWQTIRASMREDEERAALTRPRWLRVVFAVITCGLAVLAPLMVANGIAVIATDGAWADQPSATREDWLFTGLFAAATPWLLAVARRTVRGARRSQD